MKAMTGKAPDWSSDYTSLDTIRLSEMERRRAYASLRNGEAVADSALRAMAEIRAIARRIERTVFGLMGPVKR